MWVLLVTGDPGRPGTVTRLRSALSTRGVGRITTAAGPASIAPGPDLAIMAAPGALLAGLPWRHGTPPVLRLDWEARHTHIGPQFRYGHTACPRCVQRSLQEVGFAPARPADAEPLRRSCDWAAREAVRIITANPAAAPPRTMRRVTPEGRYLSFLAVPYPDCSRCRWVPGEDELAAVYEWQMERPQEELLATLPATRAPGPPAATATCQDSGGQRYPLPVPAALSGAATGTKLTEGVLASLLACTAGRRPAGGGARRWAPSGGNLGSTTAWVQTSDFGTWPSQPLRFDDSRGDLVAGPRQEPLRRLLAETDLDPAARTAVILVADTLRLTAKYGRFAFRLAHLDAGCAAMQLALVARAQGLRAVLATRWTSAVGEIIGLNTGQFVAAVVTLEQVRQCR